MRSAADLARLAQLAVRQPPFSTVYRLVPSRFPPVGVFDRVSNADELVLLFELEGLTNDRIANHPRLDLVAREDIRVGDGWTPVMAAFCHPSPQGTRFSDGSFGVYYAAAHVDVAISETIYHREQFLRDTNEPACSIQMRCYAGELAEFLHDGLEPPLPNDIMDRNRYEDSQRLGGALRASGSWGLSYPSARHAGGQCVALFRPPAIGPLRQAAHYQYEYDGERISKVILMTVVR